MSLYHSSEDILFLFLAPFRFAESVAACSCPRSSYYNPFYSLNHEIDRGE